MLLGKNPLCSTKLNALLISLLILVVAGTTAPALIQAVTKSALNLRGLSYP